MMVATASFTLRYDGRLERIASGRDRVLSTHAIVRRYPGRFRPLTGEGS